MMQPTTRYARNGDVSIAYQVVGEGELDLVLVTGWVLPMEMCWEDPACSRFLERLASFSRLILLDNRGIGMSDRASAGELPTLEERMDDVRAVMDAAACPRAALFGASEGALMCALFAATYPERTAALALYGGWARTLWDSDCPWQPDRETAEEFVEGIREAWGDTAGLLSLWAPSVVEDPRMRSWWNTALMRGASPSSAAAWLQMTFDLDIRQVLPTIGVPTLVLHRAEDGIIPVENGRQLGERIPDARYVELAGQDHLWWVGDQDALLDEVESFLTGAPARREPDRLLATVLFTDIVDSTRRAAELGDLRWRDLVASHDRVVRAGLSRFRGREVKTLGDGFLATFDGPARGVRCACAIREDVRGLGLDLRAGLHTGECEVVGDDIGGIAVNIGARVGALAGPGEVLVSRTVKDLVAGSGLVFEDRGERELKGVPGGWHLFAVGSA